MAARAMWKGVVRLGDGPVEAIPVKLYAAIEDRGVHFRLLHAKDGAPVRQELVDPSAPEDEEVVEREDVRRGVALPDGRFVVLSDDELAALAPEPSRDVEVLRIVPRTAVDDAWFDRPYWLGPDGDDAGYAALAATLAEIGGAAIVRWTMRNKRYQGAIIARGGGLALVRLRHAEELVPIELLEAPTGREPSDKELKLAEQLVEALAGELEPELLADAHREKLEALIEAKADGKVVRMKRAKKAEETDDDGLAAALGASLQKAKGGK
ncbi:MAG: hypothetical protein KC635_14785 [Myxococcales bacterium]|nr:hypothetical protein [Myxococcales bacterium]MCB9737097.1 Ku protein [Deltaproteobacteria bacterium]